MNPSRTMKIQNYIGGQFFDAQSGQTLENVAPATGEVYGSIPRSAGADVDAAYKAAAEAYPGWSSLKAAERSEWLMKLSNAIANNLDELARAESKDNGKPLKLATSVDIPRARDNFKFFATAILHQSTETHSMGPQGINYTLRQPIGVCGCISPWNLPLYLFSWKIAPALATGNTVVAKPSEITPATAYLLSKLCAEVGFPAGVLNIVHGLGAEVGSAIVEHPRIPVISFTGGTATGKAISSVAAPMFKKMSLELGGKNPALVFEDCDFDKTVSALARASFANQGQICLCSSRIYVQRSIYDQFKEAFVAKVKAIKVGPPSAEDSRMGALVSKDHMEKVLSYIALAKEEGGTLLAGGEQLHMDAPHDKGFYVAPTVFENLDSSCRTNQEEIFGPVVTLAPFDAYDDAVELANSTVYGLSATVWTKDLETAHKAARDIHAGIVWINCWLVRDLRTPFGGVKQSGVGREGGLEALHFFTEPKNVCIQL